MRLTNLDPTVVLVALTFVSAAGVALMYADQLAIRVGGALLSSGVALVAIGWLGLGLLWMLVLLMMMFGSDGYRPMVGRVRRAG